MMRQRRLVPFLATLVAISAVGSAERRSEAQHSTGALVGLHRALASIAARPPAPSRPRDAYSLSALRVFLGEARKRKAAGAPSKGLGYWEGLQAFFEPRVNEDGRLDAKAHGQAVKHRSAMPSMPRPGADSGIRFQALGNGWQYLGPTNWQTNATAYMGAGPTAGCVLSAAYDRSNPGTYYIGAAEGGVWKTADYGATWRALSDQWSTLAVPCVAVDPTRPHIVFAGTGSWRVGYATPCRIMRSLDGGNTWSDKSPPGFPDEGVRKIVIDPENPDIVLVGTGGGEERGSIYRSTNGGTTWTELLPNTGRYQSIAYSPIRANGHRRYYALGEQYDGVLYRSDDEGATWQKLNPPLSSVGGTNWDHQNGLQLACSPVGTETVYLFCGRDTKVWRSDQGGDDGAWVDITGVLGTTYESAWHQYGGDMAIGVMSRGSGASRHDVLFLGLVDLFISPSGDNVWNEVSYGPSGQVHVDYHNVNVNPDNWLEMLLANDGGVYRGVYDPATGATSFTSLNADLGIGQFYRIAVHPDDPDCAMAGSQDNGTVVRSGSPAGWYTRQGGDTGMPAISEANGDIRYAGGFFGPIDMSVAAPWDRWTYISPALVADRVGMITPIAADPNNADYLYLGTNYLWRYNRATGAWSAHLGGAELAPSGSISALAVAPTNSAVIYVGSGSGALWVSGSAGATWTRIDHAADGVPSRVITDIAVDPTNAYRILFTVGGTDPGRVYRCDNTTGLAPSYTCLDGSGATALPGIAYVSVVFDPFDPANSYYVAGDVGVFATLDGGANWSNAGGPLGLPNTMISDLQVGKNTHILYAGTMGRGIWRMPLRSSGLLVTAPNGFGSYERGDTVPIRWKLVGGAGLVDIWLVRNGVKYRLIGDDIDTGPGGVGSFDWTIASDIPTGTTNRIWVGTTIGGYEDVSDTDFTVMSSPLFTVTDPGSGDAWEQGSSKTIQWTYKGTPGPKAKLELLSNGNTLRTIASGVSVGSSGAGSCVWVVPPTLSPGTHYQVRITDESKTTRTDTGDDFAIIEKNAFNVTEPEANASWPLLTTQTIEWQYSGAVGTTVRLRLYRLSAYVRTIASAVPIGTGGAGSYSWTLPSDITPNVGYSIQVSSESAPAVLDYSGPFTIAQARSRLVLDGATGKIGYQVTLHAKMTNWLTGDPVAGKSITFSRDAHDIIGTAVTNASGDATLAYRVPETPYVTAHALYAEFAGDATYAPKEDIDSLVIQQGVSVARVAGVTAEATQRVTLSAGLNRQPDSEVVVGRAVSIWLNGDMIGAGVTSEHGAVSIQVKLGELAPGDYPLKARFEGDVSYAASEGAGILRVLRCDTTLNPLPVSGQFGETVTLKADLSRHSDSLPLQQREIVFSVAGSEVGRDNTDGNGRALCPFTIPDALGWGGKTYTAVYAGEPCYVGHSQIAALTVSKADVVIEIDAVTAPIGSFFNIAGRISRASDDLRLAGKVVVFTLDGTGIGQSTSDAEGGLSQSWMALESYGAGGHEIRGAFAGDSALKPGVGSGTLTITQSGTSLFTVDRSGIITTPVTLKAYLKRLTDNAWVAGRPVRFLIDGVEVGSPVTDTQGEAALAWTINAGPALRGIRAEFAGDAAYTASFGTAKLTAQTVATKVYVVDRTAKVKSYTVLKAYLYLLNNSVAPGKPMTVKLDGVVLGSATTNPSGYVQFGYTVAEGIGAGARVIRGEFAGDAGYNASANTGKLTVTKGDLYIWPYVRSGARGSAHPLRAYVRSLPDYVIQPGKAITYRVNGTDIGAANVGADGWASVTWSIPAAEPTGAHTATAAFAGDAWYNTQSASTTFNVVGP
jgi:hypothetical protein